MKENLKRLLSMMLVITLVFGMVIPVSAANDPYAWYGDGSATEYEIGTAAELAAFAAIVNGTAEGITQDDFAGKTVKLTADIALAEDGLYAAYENVTYGTSTWPCTVTQYVINEGAPVWTPIGSGTFGYTSDGKGDTQYNYSGNTFAGTFDGNDHVVSGVYTGTTDSALGNTAQVQGLFGHVTGTVENVTVSGCITGMMVLGGVVAYLDGGNIENCVNDAIIFADGGTTPNGGAENGTKQAGATGGIVGMAINTGGIINCTNVAPVVCANSAKGGRVAGIVGLIQEADDAIIISQCINAGNVEGYQYVAGIAGLAYGTGGGIDQCANFGDITFHAGGKSHAGGISGQFNCLISNCYNQGNIISTHTSSQVPKYFGGIGGDCTMSSTAAKIVNCYSTGKLNYIYNEVCEHAGILLGAGAGTEISGSIENCYYLDSALADCTKGVTADINVAVSKTHEELSDAGMAALLGDAFVPGGEGEYPVLAFEVGGESSNVLLGGEEITVGGAYQLDASATGTITIATTAPVTVIGNGAEWNSDTTSAEHGTVYSTANSDLSIVGSVAGINLTLKDMFLNNSGVAAVDVTGIGNTLTFDGTVIIDQSNAPNVHVGPDAGITIKGTTGSRAYLYKSSQTAGIGGNSGEACGTVVFGEENGANDFYIFMKGSRQGAVIGNGANCSAVPGNITFHSGIILKLCSSLGKDI